MSVWATRFVLKRVYFTVNCSLKYDALAGSHSAVLLETQQISSRMSLWRGTSRAGLGAAKALSAPRTALLSSAASAAKATAPAPLSISLDPKEWAPEKKRSGLLAVKIGCLPVWDHFGFRHACTVLQVEECQVTQVKTADRHGFNALQLGVGLRKARNVTKPVMGHLTKAGVPPKRELQEFRVSEDALLPLGTSVYRYQWVAGMCVDS